MPADNIVFLNLRVGMLGNSRKVSSQCVDVDADKDLLKVSKVLLDSPEYQAITKIRRRAVAVMTQLALPATYMRAGIYALVLPLVEEADAKLLVIKQQFEQAVEVFINAYPSRKAQTGERLGPLFDDSDYPSVDRVRQAFTFETNYLTLSVPGQLQNLGSGIFQRESEKASAEWGMALAEIRSALRAGFQELVNYMIGILTPTEDGKKKRIYGDTITRFKEFLETFEFKNITDDEGLSGLIERTKAIMSGTDVEDLRKTDNIRDWTRTQFEALKPVIDTMIEEQPERALVLID